MPNENEIEILVQGNQVIESTISTKEFDKAEYLSTKEAELVEHDAGVSAYITAQSEARLKLVELINSLK